MPDVECIILLSVVGSSALFGAAVGFLWWLVPRFFKE